MTPDETPAVYGELVGQEPVVEQLRLAAAAAFRAPADGCRSAT